MTERTCADCGASSATTKFRKDKRTPDGLGPVCLPCNRIRMKASYRRHGAKRNAENRARYEANKEAIREQQRQYRAENIERIRKYDRDRYAADPDKRRKHVDVWVAANREHMIAQRRQFYATNRDRILDARDFRRVQAAGYDAPCEPIIRREVWESYVGVCGICLEPVPFAVMELDHIRPVSKGGPHLYSNVQPAHKSCNSAKKDKE